VIGVSPDPNQLRNRPNLRCGKLVYPVMQFLTPRAHAAKNTSTDRSRGRAWYVIGIVGAAGFTGP
jgi:hypothetical protein